MGIRDFFNLIIDSLKGLNPNEAPVHAAALAFYTLLSIAPLATISVDIAGLLYNKNVVEEQIVAAIEETVGGPAADFIADIVGNAVVSGGGLRALLSFPVLLFGASTVFWQLRVTLNATWGLTPKAGDVQRNYLITLIDRLLAFAAVLVIGLLLIVALMLNALSAAVPIIPALQSFLVNFEWVAWLLSLVLAPLIYTVIFAAVFKFLPRATVRWRDVWLGALVTAVVFWIGGYVVWLYLLLSGVASVYGAIGSVMVFLLWIYSSVWIFLFGAKFTQVYNSKYGAPIKPNEQPLIGFEWGSREQ